MRRTRWIRGFFPLAPATAILVAACGQDSNSDSYGKMENPCINSVNIEDITDKTGVIEDVRVIKIGKTIFYIPLSWLHYNGMIVDSTSKNKYSAAELSQYIEPVPLSQECAGLIHNLTKNPPMMSRGLQFWLDGSKSNEPKPSNISENSNVYKISLALQPENTSDNQYTQALLDHINSRASIKGWVLYRDVYIDTTTLYNNDVSSLSLVHGPSSLEKNSGSSYWKKNVKVSYWWRRSYEPSSQYDKWRDIRSSVFNLLDWLSTLPSRRDNRRYFTVGGPTL